MLPECLSFLRIIWGSFSYYLCRCFLAMVYPQLLATVSSDCPPANLLAQRYLCHLTFYFHCPHRVCSTALCFSASPCRHWQQQHRWCQATLLSHCTPVLNSLNAAEGHRQAAGFLIFPSRFLIFPCNLVLQLLIFSFMLLNFSFLLLNFSFLLLKLSFLLLNFFF